MKTLAQIVRYVSSRSFPEADWKQLLAYCRERFGGGKIHRSPKPKGSSSYPEFIKWVDEGLGSGDIAKYGKTFGIIADVQPKDVIMAAYLDYEGRLIVKDMNVLDVERLVLASKEEAEAFKIKLNQAGLGFSVRLGKVTKMFRPKEFSYVTYTPDGEFSERIGMYLSSEGSVCRFVAVYDGKLLKFDVTEDIGYAPLIPAGNKEIHTLHKAAAARGYAFNAKAGKFVRQARKGHNNSYWYVNDRFAVVSDVDNGAVRHRERYKVGNYFFDYVEALTFLRKIIEIRTERN